MCALFRKESGGESSSLEVLAAGAGSKCLGESELSPEGDLVDFTPPKKTKKKYLIKSTFFSQTGRRRPRRGPGPALLRPVPHVGSEEGDGRGSSSPPANPAVGRRFQAVEGQER